MKLQNGAFDNVTTACIKKSSKFENESLLCEEQTPENKPGLFLIQIAELNKLVCRGVSPITARRWGGEVVESVPHTNPKTPNQSFLTLYQDLFLSAAPASCKLYPPHTAPPLKMNLGEVQGYCIRFVPPVASICPHIS